MQQKLFYVKQICQKPRLCEIFKRRGAEVILKDTFPEGLLY